MSKNKKTKEVTRSNEIPKAEEQIKIGDIIETFFKLSATAFSLTYFIGFMYALGCTSILREDSVSDASSFLLPFSQKFIVFHGISILFYIISAYLFFILIKMLLKIIFKNVKFPKFIHTVFHIMNIIIIFSSPYFLSLTSKFSIYTVKNNYFIILAVILFAFLYLFEFCIKKLITIFKIKDNFIYFILSIELIVFGSINIFMYSKFDFIKTVNDFSENKSNIKLVKVFSDEISYSYFYPLDTSDSFFIGIDYSSFKSNIIPMSQIIKLQSDDIPSREPTTVYTDEEDMIKYLSSIKVKTSIEDYKKALEVVKLYYSSRTNPTKYNPELFVSLLSDNYYKKLFYPSIDVLKNSWEKEKKYRNKDINEFIGVNFSIPVESENNTLNVYSFEYWMNSHNETLNFQLIKNDLNNKWEINNISNSAAVDMKSNKN